MNKSDENRIIQELSPRFGNSKVQKELEKYKYFSFILNDVFRNQLSIFINIFMYLSLILSFEYELIIWDYNILKSIPITFFTYTIGVKFLIPELYKKNIIFLPILSIMLLNLFIIARYDVNMFVGFLLLIQTFISKKISLFKEKKL